MASFVHEAAVRVIRERHDAKVKHFARAVLDACLGPPFKAGDECQCEDEPCSCAAADAAARRELRASIRFLPDAWKYDEEKHVITCWEVTATSGLTSKEGRYIDLFWAMDDYAIGLRLVHVDVGGTEAEIDLTGIAFESLRRNATRAMDRD